MLKSWHASCIMSSRQRFVRKHTFETNTNSFLEEVSDLVLGCLGGIFLWVGDQCMFLGEGGGIGREGGGGCVFV